MPRPPKSALFALPSLTTFSLPLSLLLFGGLMFFIGLPPSVKTVKAESQEALATFAGGCFWCMEHPFDKLSGVTKTIVGYAGGQKENPTYKEVSSGVTGHTEAVQVYYDPAKVTYQELLEVFWRQIDPTDPDGQFVDRGNQYRSEIFFHTEEQKTLAEASKEKLGTSGKFKKPIVTEVTPFSTFYPAEEYHQDYYKTHPVRYKFYRYRSGRDQFLQEVWSK